MITIPHFKSPTLQGLRHGFFGRLGGVSTGAMESLNTYPYHRESGRLIDTIENVAENRRRILETLHIDAEGIVTANQVHGDAIIKIDRQESMDFVDADGLIVERPHIPIGVLTADCVPVIYTDLDRKVAAIVHAGWKGAFLEIHLKMVKELTKMGYPPERLVAAIGPSSQQGSYEVNQGFYEQWMAKSERYQSYFSAAEKQGHYLFDVPRVVCDELVRSGIRSVDWLRVDTIVNSSLFFSHRRSTLQKEPYSGRQLSVVCL